jgi:hypothetical protein
VLTSVELAPPVQIVSGGLLKQRREPVVVLLGSRREGGTLSCDWLFTHPGLVPGAYALTDGSTIRIPPARCSGSGVAAHSVTLEVSE